MSFGIEDGAGNSVDDPLFHEALNKAYNAGIVLVASAGNDGRDIGILPQYPACYTEVIAVSATGIQTTNGKPSERKQIDYFASWSNYGTKIDLAAPGVSVETTAMGGGYSGFSGTSASGPHVVATAALVLKSLGYTAPVPDLPELIRSKMKDTAEYLSNLTPVQQGAGLVDAGFAIANQRAPRNPKLSLLSATWGQIKDQ